MGGILISLRRILFYNTKFHEKAEKAETHCGWGNIVRLHGRRGIVAG